VSAEAEPTAERLAELGRGELEARLRAAIAGAAARAGVAEIDDEALDALTVDAVAHADGALWRRSLAQAATGELGIPLSDAVFHPAVVRAHEMAGAPPWDAPSPQASPPGAEAEAALDDAGDNPDALRLGAVHLGGIDSLRAGEDDIELRFSPAGVDVLKHPGGAAIGRLEWTEIETIELPRGRRGIGRRRVQELHLDTGRGRARFELPGITAQQLRDHLEPMLPRNRGAATR
jgi:hypothetical protein